MKPWKCCQQLELPFCHAKIAQSFLRNALRYAIVKPTYKISENQIFQAGDFLYWGLAFS